MISALRPCDFQLLLQSGTPPSFRGASSKASISLFEIFHDAHTQPVTHEAASAADDNAAFPRTPAICINRPALVVAPFRFT